MHRRTSQQALRTGWGPTLVALASASTALAGEGAGAGEALHLSPGRLGTAFGVPITNSMVAAWLGGLVLILVAGLAARRPQLVPGRLQGLLELLCEGLLGFLAGIMGDRLARKTFWFLATLFLFILLSNWLGLLPGFGTIGWGVVSEGGFRITRPLLRGADADLNLTFGMAALLSGCWLVWSVQEQGVRGFLWHIFGPKGDMRGLMGLVLGLVFFAAGLLEVISIAFRPVSMSLRLFGNIFAGETMLEAMLHRAPALAWILPVPFYFVELLVGLIQAGVFTLLAAIFVMLSCEHSEDHGATAAGSGNHAGH